MIEIPFTSIGNVYTPSAEFIPIHCGHCDRDISAHVIAYYNSELPKVNYWLICPVCSHASVKDYDGITYPPAKYGESLQGLPPDIKQAYDEARNCMSVKAHSACTLICRKILMHIAVDKGDDEGKSFVDYITYLKDNGYITAVMNDWVDKIREGGNDSTHKIPEASESKAKNIMLFTIQLLRNVYEMKHIADQQTGSESDTPAS